MKQIYKLILLLLLAGAYTPALSQKKGFVIESDKTHLDGFIRYDHKKPWEVEYINHHRNTSLTFTIDEVTSFGYKDSTVYTRQTLTVDGTPKQVFVEVIGDSAFYYFQRDGLYFRGKDTLEVMKEADLLPYLQSLSHPAATWRNELHLFKLKREPLRYFAKYNAAGKSPTVLFSNYGIFVGFNRSVLTTERILSPNEQEKAALHATSDNISVGGFADIPAWPFRNLSLYMKGSYGKMRFSQTVPTPTVTHDVRIRLDYGLLSVMPKYTVSYSRLRLSAFAGPGALYMIKYDKEAMQAVVEGRKVSLTHDAPYGLDASFPVMFGFEAGAQASFFYLPKHYISLGISSANVFSRQFDISNTALTVSANL